MIRYEKIVRHKSIRPIPSPIFPSHKFLRQEFMLPSKITIPTVSRFLSNPRILETRISRAFQPVEEREVKSECSPADDTSRVCKNAIRRVTKSTAESSPAPFTHEGTRACRGTTKVGNKANLESTSTAKIEISRAKVRACRRIDSRSVRRKRKSERDREREAAARLCSGNRWFVHAD